jgi:peptidoglycan/xylan/chitin deacetylase (PgdA/CDA1 family)
MLQSLYSGDQFPFSSAGARRNFPKAAVITNLQAGHGFSKQDAISTQTDDTAIFTKGTQSLKLTTDGANGVCFTRKSSISPAIDLTGKQLIVWGRVDDPSKLADFTLYISSNNMTAHWYWQLALNITAKDAGKWLPIVLSWSAATVLGSPDRAAINCIQWRVRDNGTGIINCSLGGIGSVAEPSAGIVSITFDDNWASAYDTARPIMDAYDMAGTMYTIPELVGATGYMTLAQLRKLQDEAGWDVSGHYQTNLTTLPGSADSILRGVKKWLGQNGFRKGINEFAYPNGDYNTEVLEAAQRHFRSARTILERKESLNVPDYHRIKVLLVVNTTTTAAIAAAVTAAITNKDWLILVFHKIVTTPTVSTEYSTANFTTVIGDIATQGILVKPVSEVLNNYA